MSKQQIIKDAYYDTSKGYQSAMKLYSKINPIHKNITYKDIKNFLDEQYTAQVNQPVYKPKLFSTIWSFGPRYNYQMDLMVYDRFEFHNYKYIMVVVDVYSRYASARAMTNNKNVTIMDNMKSIFDDMGIPKNINCDNEFDTNAFEKYCTDNNIKVYFSQPNEINKNAIVERINRTIALMLQKWRTATGKYDWYKVLPSIMENYNTTIHSTTKEKPIDIFNSNAINNQKIIIIHPSISVGDQVRIKTVKSVFDKGDRITHSKDTYTVIEKNKSKYKLKNNTTQVDDPYFYKSYELSKVGNIQYLEKENDAEEIEHNEIKQKKKIDKNLNKAGVSSNAIVTSKRVRKPKSYAEDEGY